MCYCITLPSLLSVRVCTVIMEKLEKRGLQGCDLEQDLDLFLNPVPVETIANKRGTERKGESGDW